MARRILASLGGGEDRVQAAEAGFKARLGFRLEEIARLAAGLYGGDEAVREAFLGRLVELLARKHRERPAGLKALDAEREAARAAGRPWYLEPGLAAYMLYLDRFSGDLRGFADKLPYLEELGVRLIHVMPFMKSPPGANDGGYAVSDYLEVDPRLGTGEELVEIAGMLHARGMYLAADLVLNHSADDHPWALAAKAGDARRRGYYHVFPDRSLPDAFEAAMPEVFPVTAPGNFTFVPELGAWVMTVFHSFQWDLNWSNPELFLEMLAVLLDLANMGIDLLRLDALPYLWKRPGTSCQNLEEAHEVARLLKACADAVAPGVAFLAEAIVQPSEIVRYLDGPGGEECQLAYHASLMVLLWESLATRKAGVLSASFGSETRLPPTCSWLSYVRCHDDIGLGFDDASILAAGFDPAAHRRFLLDFYSGRFPGSFADGRLFMENPRTGDARISGTCASLCGLERALALRAAGDPSAGAELELALSRVELLYGLAASLTGIPMIYAGDELALVNDASWEVDPERAEDNRWMHRPPMDWEAAARRREPGSVEARIFGTLSGLLRLRRDLPSLAQDAPFEVLPSPSANVFLCRRGPVPGADAVLVAANFAPEGRVIPLATPGLGPGTPRELLGRGSVRVAGDALELGAYGLAWLAAGAEAAPFPSPAR